MVKVSICVPVYNVEKYIERCARSLFEQTLDELEFIFVDDCSTDRSAEMLKSVIANYPNRAQFVKIIRHNKNLGPGVARETAGKNAEGEYLYFPDSDDWIEPTMMEEMYGKAVKEQADIVLCQWDLIGDRVKQDLFKMDNYSREQWIDMLIRRKAPMSLPRRMVRKSLYDKCIPYVNLNGLVRFEDYLLVFLLHYFCMKVSYIDTIFYHVIRHSDSLTRRNSISSIESSINVCTQLKAFLQGQGGYDKYKSIIQTWLYHCYVNFIMFDIEMWDPSRFRKAFQSNHFIISEVDNGVNMQDKLISLQVWLVIHRFIIIPYIICLMSTIYVQLKG